MLRPLAVGPSNKKKASFFRSAIVGAALAAGFVVVLPTAGCANQPEGERCDQNAANGGNDDCNDGFACTSKTDLGSNSDICCPLDRTTATTAVCAVKHAPVGGNPGPPDSGADASTADTSTSDSSSTDATVDGG